MISEIIKNRIMIVELSISDFKKRFVGSYFGVLWMFVQPLSVVLIYTFVFQIGFRTKPPVENLSYVLWLIPGIIPWFYFQESIIQGTNVLGEYNFLVKKVVFNVSLLPIIKLISTFLAHICFIIIMFLVFFISRVYPNSKCFLIIYFSISTSVLALGIIYLTSSINVFFKDISQIVNILLQFGMWLAPIMYSETMFNTNHLFIIKLLKLNPFYYIVKGYRYAMIGEKFEDIFILTIYFWLCTLTIFILGYKLFNKLKNHFSDVL